jgi:LacI family transcriptional regulator
MASSASSGTGRKTSRKLPTIRDVAHASGVSPSTVSNVLNGRSYAMSPETLQRVQAAILALDYRPSALARSLVTRQTSVIGIVLSEIETPLFLQALPQMELIARGAGYNILLSVARSVEDERRAVELLSEKQADGIIFFSSSEFREDLYLNELTRRGVPTVLVNRPRRDLEMGHISWDQQEGLAEGVKYLARLGHQRIGHMFGPKSRGSTYERLEGYRRGLLEAGLEYRDEIVVDGDFTKDPDNWRDSALRLLSLHDPPTAIVASDDIVASVAMRAFQSRGMQVPEDISVMGIDDQPFCAYLNPPLTTLRLPTLEAGKLAVEMVIDMASIEHGEARAVVLPCKLIERESCGASGAEKCAQDGGASGCVSGRVLVT